MGGPVGTHQTPDSMTRMDTVIAARLISETPPFASQGHVSARRSPQKRHTVLVGVRGEVQIASSGLLRYARFELDWEVFGGGNGRRSAVCMGSFVRGTAEMEVIVGTVCGRNCSCMTQGHWWLVMCDSALLYTPDSTTRSDKAHRSHTVDFVACEGMVEY
ncbi:hypothetical protein BDZ85DRAFT_248575 [Elsinoe ampelina]|uniref:Uncharacterized protein n=1 Tax=Elsinoe ampelina TaxID=302913 RepID=A0A6A6GHP5_9PEZI|nr:hypothetical protein BDZ85DRAFT_248575 [Elsinoe ampelina]